MLPPGAVDVEPRFGYQYQGSNRAAIVDIGGVPQVANVDVRRDTFAAGLAVRAGMPFRSQAEIRVPYVSDHRVSVIGATIRETSEASGLADIEITLTKQMASDRLRAPAILGSLTWKTATGEHDPLALLSPGTGYESIQPDFSFVKRQDPLAFYGTLYHAFNLPEEELEPGDTTGVRLGLLLAANPDTSLRTSVEFSRTRALERAGSKVPGSDVTYAVIEIGIATALSTRTLLDLRIGAGLTTDSPDFTFGMSLPIRFQ